MASDGWWRDPGAAQLRGGQRICRSLSTQDPKLLARGQGKPPVEFLSRPCTATGYAQMRTSIGDGDGGMTAASASIGSGTVEEHSGGGGGGGGGWSWCRGGGDRRPSGAGDWTSSGDDGRRARGGGASSWGAGSEFVG
ncbi:loricrin-like [Schistocerca serialis cubense]|uniref:loricrin-like n=1 Tax=Schistocerca serialis cubense TaxID=2023355 RepID=UPI00214F330C|nr:loricrin-like [Schistocerca serialis cubense]